jgi:hypothetical protein
LSGWPSPTDSDCVALSAVEKTSSGRTTYGEQKRSYVVVGRLHHAVRAIGLSSSHIDDLRV